MNAKTTDGYIKIRTARAYRAFSDGSVSRNYMVKDDGTVTVYDPIAEHYTHCNSLTEKQKQMIRAEARAN
jgi:hypothetical protein